MIVAVTGATGFIGGHLATRFLDGGWRVRAVVRPGSRKWLPDGVDPVEASLETSALTRAIEGASVVVHAAGLVRAARPSMLDHVNVDGTRAIVEAANATGAHLILVSSQAAAGPGTPGKPAREADDPRPVNPYGRSKLAGEMVVRNAARVPWTILRPPAVYGPRDRGFLPLFRLASRGLFPMVARPDAAFTLIHVDDVTRAIVLAAEQRPSGATMFLGHPVPRQTREILEGLAAAFGRRFRPWRVPLALVAAGAYAGDVAWMIGRQPLVDTGRLAELRAEGFVCAVDRARDLLGFTAELDWPRGAEQTARWYRDRGWV